MVVCNKCGEEKAPADFAIDSRLKSGRKSTCLQCCRDYALSRYHLRVITPEDRIISEDARLRRMYGITGKQYSEIYQQQQGLCAICKSYAKRLHIDHDHKTLTFRGLICSKCNHGLGLFRDNVDFLQAAIDYLLIPRKRPSLSELLQRLPR